MKPLLTEETKTRTAVALAQALFTAHSACNVDGKNEQHFLMERIKEKLEVINTDTDPFELDMKTIETLRTKNPLGLDPSVLKHVRHLMQTIELQFSFVAAKLDNPEFSNHALTLIVNEARNSAPETMKLEPFDLFCSIHLTIEEDDHGDHDFIPDPSRN